MIEIDHYISKLKQRRKICFILIVAFFSLPPVAFFIFTVIDTLSFGRELLGEERYHARMYDSYLYTVIMFAVLCLMLVPALILVDKIFKMYLQVINTLSAKDIKKLIDLNEHAIFYERYMPSYIIKEKTVAIFTLLNQKTIPFDEINHINVIEVYRMGYHARLKIETLYKTHVFLFYGNAFKVRNLIQEALAANPAIVVNRDRSS